MQGTAVRWFYQSPVGRDIIESPIGSMLRWAMPDYLAITLQFFHHHGYFPNLRHPRTHSEMIQHRKLFDHDPRMPPLIDKVTAKQIVADVFGPDWITPTLWYGSDPAQIPFDELTPPYVVKANHASQCNLFVFDASDVDPDRIREEAARWLELDYSRIYHEWAYSQVPRRVLVEPFIGDGRCLPVDLKFSVFGGKVHHIGAIIGRGTEEKCDVHFDREWTYQPELTDGDLGQRELPTPPRCLSEMIEAVERLAAPFGFARVDLYEVDGRPRFGEITFYPNSGYLERPYEYDLMLGRLWGRSKQMYRSRSLE